MGQGAAEAYLFAKEGAKVVATDMCEDILRETVQKINEDFSHSTIALKLNVTDEEEWKKVVEECINQFGTVDILLNNAGIGSKGINYDKTDYQAFENVMKINAWGPFVGMKTVAPIMIKNKKGSIINVSSLAAVKSIEFNATFWLNHPYNTYRWCLLLMERILPDRYAVGRKDNRRLKTGAFDSHYVRDFANKTYEDYVEDMKTLPL